jgi:hypothetical protein
MQRALSFIMVGIPAAGLLVYIAIIIAIIMG